MIQNKNVENFSIFKKCRKLKYILCFLGIPSTVKWLQILLLHRKSFPLQSKLHVIMVFFNQWKILDETLSLNPRNVVWKKDDGYLVPIPTDKDVAPANILKAIKCRYKSTSKYQCGTSLCSCKRNGLKCMSEHGGCHGEDCNNKKVNKLSHYHIIY